MKHLFTLTICALFSMLVVAQVPHKFNYQAVARDASGSVLTNQNVAVRFTIRDISATGPILYQEKQILATNQLGLFSTLVVRWNFFYR